MVPRSMGNIVGTLHRYVSMGVGSLRKAGFAEEKNGNGPSGYGHYGGRVGEWFVGTNVVNLMTHIALCLGGF
jgi:hypothetical protein